MAATDPLTSVPRRISMRPARTLWIGISTVVLCLSAVFAGNPATEEQGDDAPLPAHQVQIAEPAVYQWVFGNASDAEAARKQLRAILQKKIAIVDHMCKLTDAQKEKLELAGVGDNKRLVDRVEKLGLQFQRVRNDPGKVNELRLKAEPLRVGQLGIFKDDSLFIKELAKLLTAEQLTRYEPLRVIIHAGGLIQTRQRRSEEGLAVLLTGTTIANDDLAHLKEIPNLQDLSLGGTRVTDAALPHLKDLSSLYLLSLFHTNVTDAGLVHLKELTGLQDLSLTAAPVTGAGLAQLKGLTKLEYLALNQTQVNDAGLAYLQGLTGLRGLALDSTPVTDKGLTCLTSLTSLQQISLTNTHVTNAGVAELKRALPGLAVDRGRGGFNPVGAVQLMRPAVGLESKTVRKELKLTDEQEHKALAIIEKICQARKKAGFDGREFSGMSNQDREARLAEFQKTVDAANDEATGLLTDEQIARFNQIRIWIAREQALFCREIIAELNLVTDQTDALTTIYEKEYETKREKYKIKMRDLKDVEARRKDVAELEKSAGVEYMDVLTMEQREQFERMRGPKFEVDISEFPATPEFPQHAAP